MSDRGSEGWRYEHYGEPCQADRVDVAIGDADVSVDRRTAAAFAALAHVLAEHGYDVHPEYPDGDTGSYNCRKIGGSDRWSSHAWAIAVDVNWNDNPRRSPLTTDMPTDMVEAVEALRTGDGAPVFRWGGRWSTPDPMHYEVIATPSELSTGIKGADMAAGHSPIDRSAHSLSGIPAWGADEWDAYVEAGGSSVPESGVWPAHRVDLAWVVAKFVAPLERRVAELEEQVQALQQGGSGGGDGGPHTHEATVTLD